VSGASVAESRVPSPQPSTSPQGRRFSMVLLKGQLEPTVVHRTRFKSRPGVISIDRGIIEITQEVSLPSSPESSTNSGKSSIPRPGESTEKTSLDSKFSSKSKGVSQHSSENKKVVSKFATGEGCSNENNLASIAEVECLETPEPVPSEFYFLYDNTQPSDKRNSRGYN
jgi:protein-serine/threonine kinase